MMRKDLKGRNLHRGEGQRADGRYCFRYVDAAGKRRYIYAADLPELREREEQALRDRSDGIVPEKITVNDLFERYLASKHLAGSTKSGYTSIWNAHVRDGLGRRRASDVHASDIRMLCAELSRGDYARSTIKTIVGILRPCLELAVEDNVIRHNPAAGVDTKEYGLDPVARDALTAEQQMNLLGFVRESGTYKTHYPLLIVMIGTGLRAGELIALTWDDVSFENREIAVSKQLIYKNFGDGYRFHLSDPKTAAGTRKIPMTGEVYEAFLKQKEINFLRGIPRDVEVEGLSGFVFPSADGGPTMPGSLNSILYHIVDAYNTRETRRGNSKVWPHTPEYLPKFSAHVLRHTACTRMAEAGIDLKAVSYILGHSDGAVTMTVYDHITDASRVQKELEKIKVDMGAESSSNGVKMVSNGSGGARI